MPERHGIRNYAVLQVQLVNPALGTSYTQLDMVRVSAGKGVRQAISVYNLLVGPSGKQVGAHSSLGASTDSTICMVQISLQLTLCSRYAMSQLC